MLTREQLIDEMKRIDQLRLELISRKNNDYATNQDALSNFKVIEALGVIDYKRAMLVRMADKFARISNLMKDGKEPAVVEEKMEDTLLDLMNYAGFLLVALWVESDEKSAQLAEVAKPLWGGNNKGINLLPEGDEHGKGESTQS